MKIKEMPLKVYAGKEALLHIKENGLKARPKIQV